MKRCVVCKVEKVLAEYNQSRSRNDGKQPHCRDCNRERSKAYYRRNRAHHRKVVTARKKLTIAQNKQLLLEYLRRTPCVDCGEPDPVVLDLDHVRGEKTAAVTYLVARGCSWSRIVAEIEKCMVRCANCHRRKTAKQLGYYRAVCSAK